MTERQDRVEAWARTCFGDALFNPRERVLRVLEEALELAQVEGISLDEVKHVAAHVFGRPVGDVLGELGGLRFTILAYAASRGLSADDAERSEVERVLSKPIEHFQQRRQEKAKAGISDVAPCTLQGIILDCQGDLAVATAFWSAALRLPVVDPDEHQQGRYAVLGRGPGGLSIEVQVVDHEPRAHLDLQAADLEAETLRLAQLGAHVLSQHEGWVVLRAPTGQNFCVLQG